MDPLKRGLDMALFFENEMIRRKQRDDGIGMPLTNAQEREQDSRHRFSVQRLEDDILRRSRSELPSHLGRLQMMPGDDHEQAGGGNDALRPVPGMFKHGPAADEVHVLLGQVVVAALPDVTAQPRPVSCR